MFLTTFSSSAQWLIITSLVIAAMFGIAFAAAWRLSNVNKSIRKRVQELKGKNNKLAIDKEHLKCTLDRVCNSMTDDKITYYASPCLDSPNWVVLRRSFVDGSEYHTFIKRFSDEDSEFNQREAEELCEILNS